MKMDEIKLTTKLVNSILQYLGTRPFVEVANLITAVQQEAAAQGAQPVADAEEAPKAE
jgi:hypothetical protein